MTTNYSLSQPGADTYDRLYCIRYDEGENGLFNRYTTPIACDSCPVIIAQLVSGVWVAKTMDQKWIDKTVQACKDSDLGQRQWIYVAESD